MIPKPYNEKVEDGKRIRRFYADTPTDELLWHFDLEDRLVKIIEAGGWYFQRDGELPQYLEDGDQIIIKKGEWHRILVGVDDLLVEINSSR